MAGRGKKESRAELKLRGTLKVERDYLGRPVDPPSDEAFSKPVPVRPSEAVAKARRWLRPYVQICDEYARQAADERNRDKFCRWVRLAARRYLNDRLRARQPNPPFYFDEWFAQDPCDFIERLPHVEGSWSTRNIVLHASDVFFVVNLFGFRSQDGTRRFTNALKAVARKNAKSTISAAIGLYCETSEGENGPQVVSAATTGSQARIIFGIAKRMVEVSSALREGYHLEPYNNSIVARKCLGSFKPINSKASTQDGLNPSAVLLDEIHAHKTHDLVNVLRSASGARNNSLFLFTTTEGYETAGPWPELRQFAKQILEGTVEADHFFVVFYALDDEQGKKGEPDYVPADDEFDEAKWIKANPLIEVNPTLFKKIQEEASEAKRLPGRLAEFRIKRLNRSSATAGAWINLLQWKQCSGPVNLDALTGKACYGGLDLASTRDIASFRLVWHMDQRWYTYGWRFVPKVAVKYRNERGLVPYQAWVTSGHLIEAGDEVLDYDVVEQYILAACKRFIVKSVGYDNWNAAQLAQKLKDQKVPMEMFIQGAKSYHPAMKELERVYAGGTLNHGNDPVLNWCMANMVARVDVNMNMAPDRKNAPDKIDDGVALLMAIGQAIKVTDQVKSPTLFFV